MPIKGCWSRASTAVLGLLTGVVRVVRRVAVWVAGNAATVLGAIRERHRERMLRDPSYRTAIATGLSALLVTITPQPAVAATLAVLVSEHLGSPREAQRDRYDYDADEDDGYEAYDARRAWSSSPSSRPQGLWDTYTGEAGTGRSSRRPDTDDGGRPAGGGPQFGVARSCTDRRSRSSAPARCRRHPGSHCRCRP